MKTQIIKIAGVFAIEDKEDTLSSLYAGDRVRLVREPSNDYDENSIRVDNSNGDKLGYIPKSQNKQIAYEIDNIKASYDAFITKVNLAKLEIFIEVERKEIIALDGLTKIKYEGFAYPFIELKWLLNIEKKVLIYEQQHLFDETHNSFNFKFSDEAWEKVWRVLTACNFLAWQKAKLEKIVCDGLLWKLNLSFTNRDNVKIEGYEDYPQGWYLFTDFLNSCFDLENIVGEANVTINSSEFLKEP